jgi:hypothetical protein
MVSYSLDEYITTRMMEGISPSNGKLMTIITPSIRVSNLTRIKESIDFDYVHEWIIVYDGNHVPENTNLFGDYNGKIKEYVYKGEGVSGNPQRNYALSKITNPNNTFLYYLDDDNIIHPKLYKLMDIVQERKMYTFNQAKRIKGNTVKVYHIDTAMMLIDFEICKHVTWRHDRYDADGHYIQECYEHNNNKDRHIFIDEDLSYYNHIGNANILPPCGINN